MLQNYLMVDESTNIVDNIQVWDGNPSTWQPPSGYLTLVQATTPAFIWYYDQGKKDWLITEKLGAGTIGFKWDGVVLRTNQPKPRG